ncbi:hypothetical protein MXAN_1015 [Myxococcus xanthus DK 1622]|uniref:Uncharacterized protein n=1 Tax=Myxococcus xanthus (strain DK1622) TaxID=246197 RepID=Q1DDJ7_MYXXD|nr:MULTISPECIES: hypothetical protein [Myxococcus]ABF86830.1 hypothetical protein MXAN_1015 [Myxococcus xanthus DK 1622]NOJ52162.1 hypothetical protein [Myxococcus xanthus]QPM80670.1 hypothetical protein I5Q59_05050 [Myxococcus xanthus]QVW69731.1 hypothetical protein JTM82_09340 [Myxococcus xanthus DZ2]QZZ48541.1 hypothetical protein MyxoNM_04970 [Myxococcus xanthus]
MKNLTVAVVFCLSMASLFTSLRADALSSVHIEKGLSPAQSLSLRPDDGKGGGDDKGDKGGGEEDEEEYRKRRYAGLSQKAAMELVDPGALTDVIRLQAAVKFGQR